MTGGDLAARIAHGLRYPFDPPGESYLFRAGRAEPLGRFDPSGRTPVVASGSNGSPQRLAEKYGEDAEIPVTWGTIRDLVPVFAARLTGYGSVPATLAVIEGATAQVHVTWLTEPQIEIMHGTESVGTGYAWCRLSGFDLDLGPHGRPETAFAYLAIHGSFAPEDRLMPLKDVSQHDAQRHAMRAAKFDGPLEDFVARHLTDVEYRQAVNSVLAAHGQPIGHPRIERLI
ncbi:MAG: hypothetical protein ACMVY4_19950 [Minwuia sp.]|uniref:hypothetical protein n=1 Tax=Minwuia sp. TaxID=2493630 RepID=UPI003A8687A7